MTTHIEVIIDNPRGSALRYSLGLAEKGQQFELIEELIENKESIQLFHKMPYYELQYGRATLSYMGV